MIPNFEFNNMDDIEVECDFSGTKICYSKEKTINSLCLYPNYDCMACVDYSFVDKNICKCMDGFVGAGYIKCVKETKIKNGKLKLLYNNR